MGIIDPQWSKRPVEDSCWYCEHFQRYAVPVQGGGWTWQCEGECRKYPPYTTPDKYHGDTGQVIYFGTTYSFWLTFGQLQWCSGFQRSLEQDIPDPPAIGECNGPPVISSTTPPFYHDPARILAPFSKRPAEDSCWYCEQFQRLYEDPEGAPGQPCFGYCRIQPQDSYRHHGTGTGPEDVRSGFAQIFWSAQMWCNRWERSQTPVPPVPQNDGVDCKNPEQP